MSIDAHFTESVKGTGRFGQDNTGGSFIYQDVSTPGGDRGRGSRVQASFDYNGGTPHFVVSTSWVNTHAGPNVKDFVWGLISTLDNYAVDAQNVAIYGQAKKKTNAGPTFGGVFEVIDETGGANPTSGHVAMEIDLRASNSDAHRNRIGVHMLATRVGGTATAEFARGFWIDAEPGARYWTGLHLTAPATFGVKFDSPSMNVGFDFSGTNFINEAIRFNRGQKISWEGSNTLTTMMSPGMNVLQFLWAGTEEKVGIDYETPGVRVNGTKVLGSRQPSIPNANGNNNTDVLNQILAAMRAHGLIG